MKTLLLLLLSLSNFVFAQKVYTIENTSLIYSKPKDYVYKSDNFAEAIESGKKILSENENLNFNVEESILFSLVKEENSPFNIVAMSYLTDDNIQNFGFENYSDQLILMFQGMYQNLRIESAVTKEKIRIDTKEFYLIKSIITGPHDTYTNHFYFAKIDNKELQITAIFDNESDEKLILQSISDIKFK